MIIGEALKRLIDGTVIDLCIGGETVSRRINFHYGDQKELIKWIANKNGVKYPLVWYVVNPFYEQADGYKLVSSSLMIFQHTQIDWFNDTRSVKSYDEIIEPTWQTVKKLLDRNKYITLTGDLYRKYRIKDEPSWGVDTEGIRTGQTDFTSKRKMKTQSVALDVVDGRIIELEFRIKTNCIK